MVLDTLTNLPSYNALNSHFAKVCAYLKEAEYLQRNPQNCPDEVKSYRVRELFNAS